MSLGLGIISSLYHSNGLPTIKSSRFNEEIIPKVHLVPKAQPKDTNVPSGIIPISQYIFDTVSAQGEAEGPFQ